MIRRCTPTPTLSLRFEHGPTFAPTLRLMAYHREILWKRGISHYLARLPRSRTEDDMVVSDPATGYRGVGIHMNGLENLSR
jgi:hypothetical protein